MMGENVIYSLRNKLYKYIQHANIPFHDRTPSGTLFVRITSDVEDIITFFKDVITTFIKDIVMIIALATMMLLLDYKLALICFLLIPFVIITSIIITKISKKVREYSKKVKTQLNIFLAESIYVVKLIKIFNRQYEKEKECEKLCIDFFKSRIPTSFTEGFLIAFISAMRSERRLPCGFHASWSGLRPVSGTARAGTSSSGDWQTASSSSFLRSWSRFTGNSTQDLPWTERSAGDCSP